MSSGGEGITLSKKHIIIILSIFVLLLAGAVILGLSWDKLFGGDTSSSVQEVTSSEGGVELDPNAGEYKGKLPKESSGPKEGIKIPGYPSITVAKDTQDVKMALLNPEGNPCYFKFVIAIKETDEVLFESQYVEPSKCIYDVHLTRPLSEGEYPAVIKISTLSLDGKTPLNGANVETVLIAK